MQAESARVGPAGQVLAANIRRVREAQRLTYAELSRRLAEVGLKVPVLSLQRIETGMRRVDFDDLLGLAYVLKIAPVDLMVSNEATDEPYPVTPKNKYTAESVRDWVSGQEIRLQPSQPVTVLHDGTPLWTVGTVLFDAIQWMPSDRRKEVMRRWLREEEEEQDQ